MLPVGIQENPAGHDSRLDRLATTSGDYYIANDMLGYFRNNEYRMRKHINLDTYTIVGLAQHANKVDYASKAFNLENGTHLLEFWPKYI